MATSFSHTPLKEAQLDFLSSAALTALSNLLTEKAASINSKLREMDSKIKLLENKNNLSTENRFSTGPLLLEVQLLKIASEEGMSLSDVYENPPSSLFDVSAIEQSVQQQIPKDATRQKGLFSNTELQTLQSEKGSITAISFLILDDIDKIGTILESRANGESPEPRIKYGAFEDLATLDDRDLADIAEHLDFITNKIVIPLKTNKTAVDAYKAQLALKDKTDTTSAIEINLLGPPISTEGKFILTDKGLYYDVRNGGLPSIAIRDMLFDSWQLGFAPNMGGRGIEYDDFDLLEYSNTVLSPEYTATNDTVDKLYEIDSILESIEKNKAKHMSIVSGQLTELIVSGYAVSSAMVQNYHRSIAAISQSYDVQLVKRKKQLQIAGLFGGFIITNNEFPIGSDYILEKVSGYLAEKVLNAYETDTKWQVTDDYKYAYIENNGQPTVYKIIKHIPVNDFSFLKGTGISPDIDNQKKNVLQSADVKDVVLPIKPKFLKSNRQGTVYVSDFSIPIQGIGTFIHASGTSNVSSVVPFIKSLTDDIETENLVAMYNFLNGDIESPSSVEYLLPNEAHTSQALNGKLVSPTLAQVFPSGLGIAYLGGTLYDAAQSQSPEPWYSQVPKGSYVRLPNNIKDGQVNRGSVLVDDLTYNEEGFAFDYWVYVPTLLTEMTRTHRYRTIIANENTGAGHAYNSNGQITASRLIDEFGQVKVPDQNKTHGMIIGFNVNPSKVMGTAAVNNLRFGIYPTVSQNHSNGKFGPSVACAEKVIGNDPRSATKTRLGLEIDYNTPTASGKTILACSGQFVHMAVSFDYKKDQVKVYLDKEILATSSLSVVFNTNPGTPLNIPSPAYSSPDPAESNLWSWGINLNQQEDDFITYPGNWYESLHEGIQVAPNGVPLFTPWIIGGGFTDSIPRSAPLEAIVGHTTPLGFLGSNTNDSYFTGALDSSGGVVGQHSAGLGGTTYGGVNRGIPRSGLDGFIGSFKMYRAPLNNKSVEKNYNAQQSFFKNIKI